MIDESGAEGVDLAGGGAGDVAESDTGDGTDGSPDDRVERGRDDRPLFDPRLTRFPWVAAGIAGATTFLVEYVLVALLFVLGPISTGADAVVDTLTIYGFTLFGAHLVPVVRSARGVAFDGDPRVNIVLDTPEPVIPVAVYLAIPILALLVAGALFESWRADGGEGLFEGSAIVGAGLATGYVVVGMATTLVFVLQTSFDPGTLTESIDRVTAFAALLGYPVIVGSLGALLVRGYGRYAG